MSNDATPSWPTKIRGAIQVTHGLGEAIRGSLGATDIHRDTYTSSDEITQRGRHEIAVGLARMRGIPTAVHPAPVYNRRQSYPVHQYPPERSTSLWGGRQRALSARRQAENPPTASDPFEKYYEHPHVADQDHDPGFAGLGAGIDPSTRKLDADNAQMRPAFLAHRAAPEAATMQAAYPVPAQPHPAYGNSNSVGDTPRFNFWPAAEHDAPAPPQYVQPPTRAYAQEQATLAPPPNHRRRRSLSLMLDRTRNTLRLKNKGKGKQSMTASDLSDNVSDAEADPSARSVSAPATPFRQSRPPHQHESALETAGYDVLSYDAKDAYPQWPSEAEMRASMQATGSPSGSRSYSRRYHDRGRLEPVRNWEARK
ncbi:hypothetical protein MKEN_01129600 [Mycena kentingensis (nom. inval.)]|nr:hypothetical protein MKEN_01129600 [Mycena kentingensis (nom. inval.)]